MAPRARGLRHAWYNTRGWRDEQRVSPVIPHTVSSYVFCAFGVSTEYHWLARKIDFLVRVSRRVPEVPRFYRCRSTVRHHGGGRCEAPKTVYAGIHHAPGCTPRTGKPQVATQAFRTERRYCGTSNQMPGGNCRACSQTS